jgi:deoxycytidylate deaminase
MCAKAIINAGISGVVYLEKYRNEDGLRILEQSGIETCQFELQEDMY